MKNAAVLLVCVAVGILAIQGARMVLYSGVLGGGVSGSGFLGSNGGHMVAWVPPILASFLIGVLLVPLLGTASAVRWALAYGLAVDVVWLAGQTVDFRGNLDVSTWIGFYSWYLMPPLGAVLGSYAARWVDSGWRESRLPESQER